MAKRSGTVSPQITLTKDDCDCIDQALELLGQAKEALVKCKACGMGTEAAEEEVAAIEAAARAVKAQFFPEQVP